MVHAHGSAAAVPLFRRFTPACYWATALHPALSRGHPVGGSDRVALGALFRVFRGCGAIRADIAAPLWVVGFGWSTFVLHRLVRLIQQNHFSSVNTLLDPALGVAYLAHRVTPVDGDDQFVHRMQPDEFSQIVRFRFRQHHFA